MPRPIRWLQPRTRWFVTSRTLDAKFAFVPNVAVNQCVGFWFGRALKRFPGVHAHAIYVASNHLHACVTDRDGSLSAFVGYFLGQLAKDVNALRERRGPIFHRRFSAEPILDDDAVAERIAYLVCNPIDDRLLEDWREWPGILLWTQSDQPETYRFRRLNETAYDLAKAHAERQGKNIKQEDYFEEETVTISPVDDGDGGVLDPNAIVRAVERRAQALREQHRGKPYLGVKKILRQDANDAPKRSDHSPRPLCHTTRLALWQEFRERWRSLVATYREISERFRQGALRARFPAFTFPPWRPLIVPLQT
ncbi:MAG: hypothetical protein U0610_30425 [bacterium]